MDALQQLANANMASSSKYENLVVDYPWEPDLWCQVVGTVVRLGFTEVLLLLASWRFYPSLNGVFLVTTRERSMHELELSSLGGFWALGCLPFLGPASSCCSRWSYVSVLPCLVLLGKLCLACVLLLFETLLFNEIFVPGLKQ